MAKQDVELVIIDTDPGIDDAFALFLAMACPEIKILGITITHGNSTDLQKLAQNACLILALGGHGDVPVYIGESKPVERPSEWCKGAVEVHGHDALGDIQGLQKATKKPEYGTTAIKCILDACIKKYPNQVTLITLGPLTNIARAVQRDPSLPRFVKNFACMGGAIGVPGNVTPVAEANIHNDPEAARIVFQAGWTITLAALNITEKILFDEPFLEELGKLNKIGKFMRDIVQCYISFHERTEGRRIIYCHDPTPVMAVTHPHLFESVKVYIDIETKGVLTVGETVADFNRVLGKSPQVNLLTKVDINQFKQVLKERILSYSMN